jgi:uncharacterized protein YjbJ (UPF0337 family)
MDPKDKANQMGGQVKDAAKKATENVGDQIDKTKDQVNEAFGRAKDASKQNINKNRVNPYDPSSRPAPMPDDLD